GPSEAIRPQSGEVDPFLVVDAHVSWRRQRPHVSPPRSPGRLRRRPPPTSAPALNGGLAPAAASRSPPCRSRRRQPTPRGGTSALPPASGRRGACRLRARARCPCAAG